MNPTNLENIVQTALKSYPKNFTSATFFAKETATIYKLLDAQSNEYALKIFEETTIDSQDNEIEVRIIAALQKEGTIRTPRLVKNNAGQYLTLVANIKSKTNFRILISEWLDGVDFNEQESEERLVQLGELVGKLHQTTKTIHLPANLQPKKWNQVFYFRNEQAVYRQSEFRHKAGSALIALLDEAIPKLNTRLKRIYESATPQLLHGDLNPWNIKIVGEELAFLDFADAILGHPLHEIAIILYYYRDHPTLSYASVKKYFLEGYRRVERLEEPDDADIEWLMMARKVNFLNYVLTLEDDYHDFLQKGIAELRAFLQLYR